VNFCADRTVPFFAADKVASHSPALQLVRGRFGRRQRQDHPKPVRTSSTRSIIVLSKSLRPASASRLCRKRSASAMMREYRPMAAPFAERGLADPTDHVASTLPSRASGRAVRGKCWYNFSAFRRYWRRLEIVLPGLVPGIHAFISGAKRRGWPSQARARRNSTFAVTACFPRTARPVARRE
jgi:hypothetical protein